MAEPSETQPESGKRSGSAADPDAPVTPPADDEAIPGIAGPSSSGPAPLPRADQADDDALPAQRKDFEPDPGKNTPLHQVLRDQWGTDDIAYLHLRRLQQFAQLDTAKSTGQGFVILSKDGNAIKWDPASSQGKGKPTREAITGDKKHFTQADAATIIALARVKGWDEIELQGNAKQKDMLWLATMAQSLNERQRHLDMGRPDAEFKGPRVTNHPNPGEDVLREYQKLLEKFNERNKDKLANPGVSESETLPGISPTEPAGRPAPDAGGARKDPAAALPQIGNDPANARKATATRKASRDARGGRHAAGRKPAGKIPLPGTLTPTYNAASARPEPSADLGPAGPKAAGRSRQRGGAHRQRKPS